MNTLKHGILIGIMASAASVFAQQLNQVGAPQDFSSRYATDAYPGFDADDDLFKPERKEPRLFSWFTGPKKDTAREQWDYCQELEANEDWSKAIKHYDALVREWPTAAEAVKAQLRMAELLEEMRDLDEAFDAYRYLIDFYPFHCGYDEIMNRMYDLAKAMDEEGKWVVFFHFRNEVEVRHAYEACVVRAPGAAWAPEALLAIARLREEEKHDEEAVAVYENLRNLHYETKEARIGTAREAAARLRLLGKHGSNRARCQDTVAFLEMARTLVNAEDRDQIDANLAEARGYLEEEAYRAARFYDSSMRTKRSAISAYERYLTDFPEGAHAESVRERLLELKGVNE